MHPLDHPVWNALIGGWAPLAQGDDHARRIDPRYGPFGAPADMSPYSIAALATLVPDIGELWLVGTAAGVTLPGIEISRSAMLAQMIAPSLASAADRPPPWVVLTGDDAPEMRALALLTKPGPFFERTHELGRFIGIRCDGRLVAMAGERMRMDGFAEVSGVCTHPDHRGRGYAGALMQIVAQAMLDRGEIPFLHAYASNEVAIALYRTLGFTVRAELPMAVMVRTGTTGLG